MIPGAPAGGDGWTPLAAEQARVVARLRDRGHSISDIRAATLDGRLAFGYVEDLLPAIGDEHSLKEAAKITLRRRPKQELELLSRGFRWVSEVPYNR